MKTSKLGEIIVKLFTSKDIKPDDTPIDDFDSDLEGSDPDSVDDVVPCDDSSVSIVVPFDGDKNVNETDTHEESQIIDINSDELFLYLSKNSPASPKFDSIRQRINGGLPDVSSSMHQSD